MDIDQREQIERLAAAEKERHDLLAQSARTHLSNVAVEMRRYQLDMEQIERVYRMRLGQEV